MSATFDLNERPDYDGLIQKIADYTLNYQVKSKEAWNTARNCLMGTLGCVLSLCGFLSAQNTSAQLSRVPLFPMVPVFLVHLSGWIR